MNVLKPNLKTTIETLLGKGLSQREISRKTGINRKTIRRYGQIYEHGMSEGAKCPGLEGVAGGFFVESDQNAPPWPPGLEGVPKQARSACETDREWIQQQVELGRNAMAIYQDLVEQLGFAHCYNSVKRFVRALKKKDPEKYDRLEYLPGEESQVDYGTGAPTLCDNGRYRRPRLFVMVLKYSGRTFRKVVWKSSQETWCRLHEEAFRYFGGCPQYVSLDNLKEGVIRPDIYDPDLNVLYAKMLSHYGVAADPARVRDPNRKGSVENSIKHTQDTALKGKKFETIESQNEWLRHWEERWASQRIHGRSKHHVEEMFWEEKPYLLPLPLTPFAYFRQETRSVYDDGTIQVGNCYYAAGPALLCSEVAVRIYAEEIEILDVTRMEVIRRHPKGKRPGSLLMAPEDRIFNPSRETDRLLSQAEVIGPHTFALCERWFNEEGRSGQRRMYGLVNLVRHYPARYVEKAAELARENGLKSSKAIRRIVESMAAEADERKESSELTQEHPLIRPGEDYAIFWEAHAVGGSSQKIPISESHIRCTEPLKQIAHQANWLKVIDIFGLVVDPGRSRRDDEIWIRSPFTQEEKASMHVSLSENIYKDFSSGKGGGIIGFCRDMLRQQGREMTMFDVAQWMVEEGICTDHHRSVPSGTNPQVEKTANTPITIDLRRYLRPDHPEMRRRGISVDTCRYLGCGFLPQRTWANTASPLNSRLVFQIRGIKENGHAFQPVILSHTGRALTPEQENSNGKYWSYPFKKSWELYNQDNILMDEEAWRQTKTFGLVLVEGFFDVAKLIQAGCRNAVALMGCTISEKQIERLLWIQTCVQFDHIRLLLDRDPAGQRGLLQVREQLTSRGLSVSVFDWSTVPQSIKDPADMSVDQLRTLRRHGIL